MTGVDKLHTTTSRSGPVPRTTQNVGHESRRVESGRDWLDNNGVNLLMAATMSIGAMGIAQCYWGLDVADLLV